MRRSVARRDVGELLYNILSDGRKVVDGEPNGWRNRWWKIRIAVMARRILRLILKQKKSAGIVYPSEQSMIPLVLSWLGDKMMWWEGVVTSELIVLELTYSKQGMQVHLGNGPQGLGRYAPYWLRYSQVWFERLYRRMTEAERRRANALAKALKNAVVGVEGLLPVEAAAVWAKMMRQEEDDRMKGAVV